MSDKTGFEKAIADNIIRAHLAGTLPASLYRSETNPDGLYEVEVTE